MKATLWRLVWGLVSGCGGREGMDERRKRMKILKAHDLRYGAGNQGLEMLKMRPEDEDLLLDWGLEVWRSGVV